METLSFILGIVTVFGVVAAALGVVGYFKVRKLEQTFKSYTDHSGRNHSDDLNAIYRSMEDYNRQIYSDMDSRLDRLENKLTNKK